MTINQGDCGGITFWAASSIANFYSLELCSNGIYFLAVNSDNTIGNARSLLNKNANNFNQSTNLIDVLANGSHIAIYINKQLVNSTTDNTFSQGQIGLLADKTAGVSFTNAKVWTL